MTQPVLTLRDVGKTFPGVRALDGVSLSLYPGEVTALIGENGAGKSTLVKVLTGVHAADEGTMTLDGAPVVLRDARDAAARGIAAIHQETVLFDELTVAENIGLGHAPRTRLGLVDWSAMRRIAREALASIQAAIDPDTRLRELGIAQKHLVAIARALSVDARVVVMDEPTAALSQKEVEELYAIVERLKADGKAILFISHKFEEVFRIADRYTAFRDGRMVGEGLIADTTRDELVRLMVGREVGAAFPKREVALGDTVLRVRGLSHPTEFAEIDLDLRAGEIVGLYALVGSGRSELAQALFGHTRPSAGTIELDGRALRPGHPADAIGAGLVYVPEERGRQGAILPLSIAQNIGLPSLGRTARSGLLRAAEEFALARKYAERLDLRAAHLSQPVGTLSGGNQQKVVIGKWLATRPKVIIVDEPTKGIDIGSKAAVHAFLGELAAEGLAVLMISSELPEILGMADRAVVMRDGRVVARFDREAMTAEALVGAATGNAPEAATEPAPDRTPDRTPSNDMTSPHAPPSGAKLGTGMEAAE